MSAALILIITLVLFLLAYRFYGSFLNRLYGIHSDIKTPAHTQYDGVDFVPVKSWVVLFGHHFASICGAGPIVGPVLAVAYWGWAPSLIWIVFGSILLGAVADYSSLVVSMRSEGKSISDIAHPEISKRAKLFFAWFIWFTLILVIAVFAIFGAKTLDQEPSSVLPATGLIPVAILVGYLLKKISVLNATIVGLGLLGVLLLLGQSITIPFSSPVWITLLLIYCFAASVTPVDRLLQPRDYLASYLLFFTIGLGVVSILFTNPDLLSSSYTTWNPKETWPNAGPLFPMLFVTIACGAISGFHSLVSSGTTCKQIANEVHACRIGYGGMLTEGLVAVMVLICVAALAPSTLTDTLKTGGGPIAAFGQGYGDVVSFLMGDYGKPFAILALNTFILTTLDSATRIARYLTMEILGVQNKYTATLIVVVAAGLLGLTGQWSRIWPAFGTANQLIAGLSLLVASAWLLRRERPHWYTFIPAIFMLVVTTSAFVLQIIQSTTQDRPDYLIAGVAVVLIILSLSIFWEAIRNTRKIS
ncbi:MAG: carbon starvation protein A [Deltaproteobacteria bacterium CG11_big_fil_rev_8_21_14_0_20_47_16]|nr:MAG: carbon starvation protein A [Deltaproteobacteria bacterium CG11_big_fil_rev_8_21_14_0_20_47_16]